MGNGVGSKMSTVKVLVKVRDQNGVVTGHHYLTFERSTFKVTHGTVVIYDLDAANRILREPRAAYPIGEWSEVTTQ